MGEFLMPEEKTLLRSFQIFISIIQNVEMCRFKSLSSRILDSLKLHGIDCE
jgi:hypothetical protein